MRTPKPYRDMVEDVARQLDTIADKLIRRASLQQSTLSPERAEEWAVVIRGAEALLVQFADSLKKQRSVA